ncbi:hypothetical protein V493_06644 [Pseudogymnoascus sp. VKM F-4281 (FW-2241)]|nr:hypothetical protein V493_06644 [Pseudogymnoascus sp. VKM F-4281 (FW-2241)]
MVKANNDVDVSCRERFDYIVATAINKEFLIYSRSVNTWALSYTFGALITNSRNTLTLTVMSNLRNDEANRDRGAETLAAEKAAEKASAQLTDEEIALLPAIEHA